MKVSNPLTIIAIFSGLAEALATIALIQLPLEMQKIFVYFVIAFPTLIVILFFCILYFKNTVLYAPSDYDNSEHYLLVNKIKQSVNIDIEETLSKLESNTSSINKTHINKIKTDLENKISSALNLSLLTRRELEVYDMLMSGKNKYDISQNLQISPRTVELHTARVKEKLSIDDIKVRE